MMFPHDEQIEKAVLSAFIMDEGCFQEYPITRDYFYNTDHARIYDAIKYLSDKGDGIDMITVTKRCFEQGYNNAQYIMKVGGYIALASHINTHISSLKALYFRRQMIIKSEKLKALASNTFAEMGEIECLAADISYQVVECNDNEIMQISSVKQQIKERITNNRTRKDGELSGISTGFTKLDNYSHGLQKGDLVVIAGESSQGKTSFTLNIATNAIIHNNAKLAVLSLEMTNEQVLSRMAGSKARISPKRLQNERLSDAEELQIMQTIDLIQNDSLFFIEKPNLTLEGAIASIRRLKIKHNIDIVIIDFLQRMNIPRGENEVSYYGRVSKRLKDLAKELEINIILVSQLNRDKHNPEPNMSRLRGSGEIAEAADIVMMIWRPEYYRLDSMGDDDNTPSENKAWLKIEKGRNIGTGDILLNWDKDLTLFSDFNKKDDTPYEYKDESHPNYSFEDERQSFSNSPF